MLRAVGFLFKWMVCTTLNTILGETCATICTRIHKYFKQKGQNFLLGLSFWPFVFCVHVCVCVCVSFCFVLLLLLSFLESVCCFLLKQSKAELDSVHESPTLYFTIPPFSLSLAVESKSALYIPIIPAFAPGTSTREDITNKSLSLTAVGIEATEATIESMASYVRLCSAPENITD